MARQPSLKPGVVFPHDASLSHAQQIEQASFLDDDQVLYKSALGLFRFSYLTGETDKLDVPNLRFDVVEGRLLLRPRRRWDEPQPLELWAVSPARRVSDLIVPAPCHSTVVASGRVLGVGTVDGNLVGTIIDVGTGREVCRLTPTAVLADGTRDPKLTYCSLSADGRRAVLGGHAGCVVYDGSTGAVEAMIAYDEFVNDGVWTPMAVLSADGDRLVVRHGQRITIFDLPAGGVRADRRYRRVVAEDGWSEERFRTVDNIWCRPDGRLLYFLRKEEGATGSHGKDEYVFMSLADGTDGERFAHIPFAGGLTDFSPSGRWFLSTSYGSFQVREVATRTLRPPPRVTGHTGPVKAVAFVGDGRELLSVGSEVLRWDLTQRRLVGSLDGPDRVTLGAAASPQGRFLIGRGEGGVTRWDLRSLTSELISGDIPDGTPRALHDDGNLAANASVEEEEFAIWDLASKTFQRLEDPEQEAPADDAEDGDMLTLVRDVALTPDGRHAITVNASRAPAVWDVATRKFVRHLAPGPDYVDSILCLPDGEHVIGGSLNHLFLWHLPTGRFVARFTGAHSRRDDEDGGICVLVSDRHGRLVASGATDNTVRIWDVPNRALIATCQGSTSAVTTIAFDAGGQRIAAGNGKGDVLVWTPADHLATRSQQAPRDSR